MTIHQILSFKEFVLASWKARGYPTGELAEKSWELWKDESNYNGWWIRYRAWVDVYGGPMPVYDIAYDTLTPLDVDTMYNTLGHTKVAQKKLTFEEFFIAKMKKLAPHTQWTIDDIPQFKDQLAGWQSLYKEYLNGKINDLVISSEKPKAKPPIRYLNRV